MKHPEAVVLRACLQYLRLKGHFVFRVNCGGGVEKMVGRFEERM
jgi:hypothetical protein